MTLRRTDFPPKEFKSAARFRNTFVLYTMLCRFPSSYWLHRPGDHPASYTMDTGSLSPEAKRPGSGLDHLPPYNVEVKETVQPYVYSASGSSWAALEQTLPLYLTFYWVHHQDRWHFIFVHPGIWRCTILLNFTGILEDASIIEVTELIFFVKYEDTYQTVRCYIRKDRRLYKHSYENLNAAFQKPDIMDRFEL